MIVISQDGMNVCNVFDFTIRQTQYDDSGYEIVNKLDGNVYGTYHHMSTCTRIIHDIFNECGRYAYKGVESYRFPDHDM